MTRFTLHCGDNREILKTMPDNSVDSIVCDPPYELGFMGKKWDSTGIAYDITLWTECLRVLKPGGHLVAFGGTRTYHRMTCAIEDAGFEIRDQIQWIYGSGFPKSHDVSKAMDKQAGAERQVVGKSIGALPSGQNKYIGHPKHEVNITALATDSAKAWHGWGTALKPAHEPAVLARKPLTGTVADTVMTWGVGALNIDGCRVGTSKEVPGYFSKKEKTGTGFTIPAVSYGSGHDANIGRWPANVIFDEEASQVLDEQSGHSVSSGNIRHNQGTPSVARGKFVPFNGQGHTDSGGASRFFYVAKASKAEREAGLDSDGDRANHHPTVKPIELMQYLIRLVTPKGGTVLDPFMGSGSTGCAAMLEGANFIGIDITPEYVDISERRIIHYANQNPMEL